MDVSLDDKPKSKFDKFYAFSIFLWMAIIVLVGTYFRTRTMGDIPTVDWVIIAQLLTCTIGGIFGLLLIRNTTKLGFGAKVLLLFLCTVAVSAFTSPYYKVATGYFILLSGASLLTIGIVYRAKTRRELFRIENIWLTTITLILLKDTIIALFFGSESGIHGGSVNRLGLGVTHPNVMSMLATLGFWMTFQKNEIRKSILLWVPRILFLVIIVLAKSRSSILCFILGGFFWIWFYFGHRGKKNIVFKLALPCIIIAGITAGLLLLSFDLPIVDAAFRTFNRNMDSRSLYSLTGRTDIWNYALSRVFDSFYTFLVGHGYGVSRFVLYEGLDMSRYIPYSDLGRPDFIFSHAHNTYIEAIFATGLLGLLLIAILVIYGLMWLGWYPNLAGYYSLGFALRAIAVVSMICFNTVTESFLLIKLNPLAIIFFFYVIALDWKDRFTDSSN